MVISENESCSGIVMLRMLKFRTMPVSAGIIRNLNRTAICANFRMGAKRRCSAMTKMFVFGTSLMKYSPSKAVCRNIFPGVADGKDKDAGFEGINHEVLFRTSFSEDVKCPYRRRFKGKRKDLFIQGHS